MSKHPKNKSVYTSQNAYTDRAKKENDSFSELTVKIQTMDTALLLLSTLENDVLVVVFKHITEFMRKQVENIAEVRSKNMMDLLLEKDLFRTNDNVLIRRFALYIATALIEDMNTLEELDTNKALQIMDACLRFYLGELDDFCMEYLSVILNKCLLDPQSASFILENLEYLEKFFEVVSKTENPDTLLHSLEALNKILQIQNTEYRQEFVQHQLFPIDRALCELTNEFPQVRSAALKVIKTLITDTGETSPFAELGRHVLVLQQLTKMFCNPSMADNTSEVVEVLSTALKSEKMTQNFFEQNLFDKMIQCMQANLETMDMELKCKIISVFAETAKFPQYLYRLYMAHITDLFLECLLKRTPQGPGTHVVLGLNRLMKFTDAANRIVETYEVGFIRTILDIMENTEINIKTREQSSELLGQLLLHAYHPTVLELLRLDVSEVFASIFAQGLPNLSIDYILSMLSNIESLTQNSDYRLYLGTSMLLTRNMAILLKNSFTAAVLVNALFRCLCTLVDEDMVRKWLLQYHISNSIKRGLKSLANLVKTAVTNFIMQTTRFPEFVQEYVDMGVLEVLIMFQKHAFCVSTWGPAIDAILNKSLSLKFCIRNHLAFTDSTKGSPFLVSKKKLDDFRIFLSFLTEEVSPFYPVLSVNFNKLNNKSMTIVPLENLLCEGVVETEGWCYCRHPGDYELPILLEELNHELDARGLVENPDKVKRCIDFDNIAKRAKVVAELVAKTLGHDLTNLDLNSTEECSQNTVKCHLKELSCALHCTIIPMGLIRSGCQFERAILFKCLSDQIGLPSTLQRSVDGRILFNELPLPIEVDEDLHCDKKTMQFMPWRMLRPTHVVDLMYNVGELYPLQSRQALQYLRLY